MTRILFIGSTRRGFLTVQALVAEAGAELVGIISLQQHKHEVERYEGAFRRFAEEHSVPIFESLSLKDRDYAALIREQLRPDVTFVVGCRILIPPEIYEAPRLGTLAVHDSLLPEYRGFAPLNWAIINGEDHTGVTLFYLSELMDAGDIVDQERIPIGPDETAPEVYERVCEATIRLVRRSYPQIVTGTARRIKQKLASGSVTCARTPSDGLIDWSNSTQQIYNLIRALAFPYPGAFTYYQGHRVTIWRARPVDTPVRYKGRIPGRIVAVSDEHGFVDVLTGDGVLRIFEIQPRGGERQAAAHHIRSVRASLGITLVDLEERLWELTSK